MKLIAVLLSIFGLTQCKSVKLDTKAPLTIKSAYYINMVGGMPGNSSVNLIVEYNNLQNVTLQDAYFLNRKAKVSLENQGKNKVISANINTSTIQSREDLILHNNPTEELKNTPPTKKLPFNLKDNEAVISYTKNNKLYYFKVENIKKKKDVFMQ